MTQNQSDSNISCPRRQQTAEAFLLTDGKYVNQILYHLVHSAFLQFSFNMCHCLYHLGHILVVYLSVS